MDLDFKQRMKYTAPAGQSLYVLRKGVVPASTEDLGYLPEDVESLLADPDTLAVASSTASSLKDAMSINATVKVDSTSRSSSIIGMWHVPGELETIEVSKFIYQGLEPQGFKGELSKLYLAGTRRGHHREYQYTSSVTGITLSNVQSGIIALGNETNGRDCVLRFSKPEEISSIVYRAYYQQYSNVSYWRAPPQMLVQYWDDEAEGWVTITTMYNSATYSLTFNTPHTGLGRTQVNKINAGNLTRYEYTITVDEGSFSTSAIRFIARGSGSGGYIQGVSAYSRVKPDLPEARNSDVTHCIVYQANLPYLKHYVEPYIAPIGGQGNPELSDPAGFLSYSTPNLDRSFGMSSGDTKVPSSVQMKLAKNFLNFEIPRYSRSVHMLFFEGTKPSMEYMLTQPNISGYSYIDTDNILDALNTLTPNPNLLFTLSTYKAPDEGDLVTVFEPDEDSVKINIDMLHPNQKHVPRTSGTIGYAVLIHSNGETYAPSTSLFWWGLASVGLKGSGADIELRSLDYSYNDNIVIENNIEVDISFA